MWYLFFQIWIWLVLAFMLGWAACWFLGKHRRQAQDSEQTEETE